MGTSLLDHTIREVAKKEIGAIKTVDLKRRCKSLNLPDFLVTLCYNLEIDEIEF